MELFVASGAQWLGVALTAGAVICALAALTARSAFVMIIYIAAAAALAAAALLGLGHGDGALGVAVLGIAIAPMLMMGGVLLSAQASKRGARASTAILLGLAALAPIGWAAADVRNAPAIVAAPSAIPGVWLAALALVAACACVGLLGYGERGIMERRLDGERE